MHLLFSFRLSLYLTLAFACACLGYAELPLLPEITAFIGLIGGLLILAFFLEGRWWLSTPGANILGALLFAGLGFWVAYRFNKPTTDGPLAGLPIPLGYLPYLGPLLLIAMIAKLFRPKEEGDIWAMHLIGLTTVALGCVLGVDALFGGLLCAYFLCLVWNLALFCLYRETLRVEESNGSKGMPNSLLNRRFPQMRYAWRRLGMAILLGLIAFLLTPRSKQGKWNASVFDQQKMQTGLTANQGIDLNRTGTLTPSRELVFDVRVRMPDLRTPRPLPDADNQRWRGIVLHEYNEGRWRPARARQIPRDWYEELVNYRNIPKIEGSLLPASANYIDDYDVIPIALTRRTPRGPQPTPDLPSFGADRYLIQYRYPDISRTRDYLADPILWTPGQDHPVSLRLSDGRNFPMYPYTDGMFYSLAEVLRNDFDITQVTRPVLPSWKSPLFALPDRLYEQLTTARPQPWLRRYTDRVLQRLVNEGKLSSEALLRDNRDLLPLKQHGIIAKALERYLSNGEFRYTLKLETQDKSLDPVQDFLENTRAGHCERFASALALMLRSIRIPARVVLGYRGADPVELGHYEIRQSHAHAWVEAFLLEADHSFEGREEIRGGNLETRGYWFGRWQTLDPTPNADAAENRTGLLSTLRLKGGEIFREFILGFNSDKRKQAWSSFLEAIESRWQGFQEELEEGRIGADSLLFLGGSAGVIGLLLLVTSGRRRQVNRIGVQPPPPIVPFQEALTTLLARFGFRRAEGETPLAFAERTAAALRNRPGCAAVADLPIRITKEYYRLRFGEIPLTKSDEALYFDLIKSIETALTTAPRTDLNS